MIGKTIFIQQCGFPALRLCGKLCSEISCFYALHIRFLRSEKLPDILSASFWGKICDCQGFFFSLVLLFLRNRIYYCSKSEFLLPPRPSSCRSGERHSPFFRLKELTSRPRGARSGYRTSAAELSGYFNPRAREGRDRQRMTWTPEPGIFQSTRPARGATDHQPLPCEW
jgi:hypothetical protein